MLSSQYHTLKGLHSLNTDLHTALYFAANICCGECWKFVSDLTMKFKITVYALVGFIVLMNISFNILVYLLLGT